MVLCTHLENELGILIHIKKLCSRNRHPLHRKIDGAVLHAESVQRIDCLITFHTDSVLQRFMLRFEELRLDCNDHLYIYDGTNTFGNYKVANFLAHFAVDLSCGHNKQSVGTIYTDSNQVSLKYVTDGWVQEGSGFKLVLTAIKHATGLCLGFVCRNNFCIDNDLLCDGVNHCSDNSDESSALALCLDDSSNGNVLGLGMNIFIAIVVSIFSICFIFIVGVVICICRRQRLRAAAAGANNVATHPNYSSECPSYPQWENNSRTTYNPSAINHQGLNNCSTAIPCRQGAIRRNPRLIRETCTPLREGSATALIREAFITQQNKGWLLQIPEKIQSFPQGERRVARLNRIWFHFDCQERKKKMEGHAFAYQSAHFKFLKLSGVPLSKPI
uniref:CUB domain-containing protein n=1 Tax=Strigamia maritima TaxID=126957 RepID=T1J4X9_STRMM